MYSATKDSSNLLVGHYRFHVVVIGNISTITKQSVEPSDLEGAIILSFSTVLALYSELL